MAENESGPSSRNDEIARSLDAPPELLPYIPELLTDFWELGSDVETIVGFLASLDLARETTRVADFGCGKGAVAVTLALRLGYAVWGVDAFEPFIREAKLRALDLGVGETCTFEVRDLREAAEEARDYDAAVYASVGGVLGPLDACVGRLRRTVRPGGYMVLDEGFLRGPARPEDAAWSYLSEYEETRRRLTAHGDRLIKEHVLSDTAFRVENVLYVERIRSRVEQIIMRTPEAAEPLRAYVRAQTQASRDLERYVVS